MTKIVALSVGVILGAGVALGEPLLPRNLADGKKLPGSESPDKRFVILEVFHDRSTQNSVVISPSDRSNHLGFVPIHTEWSTDRPHRGRTTIKWNKKSSLVSIHDSILKHSKLHIFKVSTTGAKKLILPDLLKQCASDLGIGIAVIHSSGQLPLRWIEPSVVEVAVRVKTKKGKSHSKKYHLHVSDDGRVELPPGGR